MKRTIAEIAMLLISVTGYSQGTFIFNNFDPAHGIDAKVTDCSGAGVSVGFTAQMYLVGGTSLTPLLPMSTFQTGAAAGYVNVPANPIMVPGVPPGLTVEFRMEVFEGPDYNTSSRSFFITLGGGGRPPAPLIGLKAFSLNPLDCPEPSTIALGLLGIAALLNKMKNSKRSRCSSGTRPNTTCILAGSNNQAGHLFLLPC